MGGPEFFRDGQPDKLGFGSDFILWDRGLDDLPFLVYPKDEKSGERVRNWILACSVCFGNPDSLLSKGAVAGVFFLVAVVALVLVAIAATAFRWSRRAKALGTISPPAGTCPPSGRRGQGKSAGFDT